MKTTSEHTLVKGQSWTWLNNIYDPRLPDAEERHVIRHSTESDEDYKESLLYYRKWLKDKFIGDPKATDDGGYEGITNTVEELKAKNIVGIYKPGPVLSSITRRGQAGIPPCPVSKSEFSKYAKPIKVYLELEEGGIPETVLFEPREYDTGSYGWQKSVKLPHRIVVDGNPIEVKLQFVCNIIVVGSKEMPKERKE